MTADAVLAGVATVSVHLALRLSPLIAAGAFNDDGVYIALGRSLAEGSFVQERFVLIVLPVAGLLVAAGVDRAIGRTAARWRPAWYATLALVTAAVGSRHAALRQAAGAAFVSGDPPEPADFSPAWFLSVNSRFIYEVSAWVRDHTGPTVVVVSWPGSGLAADVRAVADRCPGLLTPWDADGGGFPRYYRVGRSPMPRRVPAVRPR